MSFEAMAWAVEQDLPAMEKIVLLMLANRTNKDTGRCDPSMERMASDCGMDKRSVQRQIKKLMERGLVSVHRRNIGDVTLPNQYSLHFAPYDRVTPRVAESHGVDGTQSPPRVAHSHPNLEDKPVREPVRDIGDFDAFWAEVPRKVGKEAARKAYASALKKTDHATIMAGIRRYAKERAGEDEKYTAHPATWLNAGRWDDVPASRQSFNDRLEGLFNGHELRIEGDDHRARPEQLSAPVSDAGSPDGPDGVGEDQADSGRYQQEVARFLAPKRFGGAAW